MTKAQPMMKSKTQKRKNRRGTAALEFAIAGPALLLIIFFAIEFARLSMIRNLTQNAAYEAARHCMVEGATEAEAIEKAETVLNMLATRGEEITINDGAGYDRDSTSIKVDISVSMEANSFVLPWLYQDRYINTTMELRVERYEGFYDASGDD